MARRFVLTREPEAAPRLTLDYAGALNEQQYAAATAGSGPLLIVAGAGTGKTRTLVYRVAYLVETGTPPEQIVLLTFTRRAAREMLTRATALLDGRCERVRGGTFHAFCLQVLRRHHAALRLPPTFTILDAADSADVIDVLRTAAGLGRSGTRFPKKRTIQSMFSAHVSREIPLADLLEARYPQFKGHLEALEELWIDYAQYKQRHALMDYDDLLGRTLHLLQSNETVRAQVAAQCRHVLVDEYQDTNRVQAALVRMFASAHGSVTAVGDDAQSIYRFRGADFRNIFDFPEHFPGTRVVALEQNYRSTQPILDLANRVLGQAARRYDKRLFTEREGGELPALVPAPDERTEARFVAQVVLMLREEGIPLRRMAVLFRSSQSAYDTEIELNARGIPYVKYGGLKLAEAAHVKDVIAYLRVAENPSDAVAWTRILRLVEGIGAKTAERIVAWVTGTDSEDSGEASEGQEGGADETPAREPFQVEGGPFSARYIGAIRTLFATLRALRTPREGQPEPPLPEQIDALLTYYTPVLERVYTEDYPKRAGDLDHIAALAEGYPTRAAFLEALALDPIDLTSLGTEPTDDDEAPLVLSTIHSAKGLEFHSVFLIQALDGILPSSYSMKEPDALDEELRLLYVAITRAEDNLFVSYPVTQHRSRTGDYLTNPSRFLDGIPSAMLEPATLVEAETPALPPPDVAPSLAPALPPSEPAAERPPKRLRPVAPDEDDGLPF